MPWVAVSASVSGARAALGAAQPAPSSRSAPSDHQARPWDQALAGAHPSFHKHSRSTPRCCATPGPTRTPCLCPARPPPLPQRGQDPALLLQRAQPDAHAVAGVLYEGPPHPPGARGCRGLGLIGRMRGQALDRGGGPVDWRACMPGSAARGATASQVKPARLVPPRQSGHAAPKGQRLRRGAWPTAAGYEIQAHSNPMPPASLRGPAAHALRAAATLPPCRRGTGRTCAATPSCASC